jgi:ABC-type branched-subunit amino acid transport system permease subunit
MLGIFFAVASLYQFGGIATVDLQWGLGYTLTTQHAMFVSLAAYAVAFMSSETKEFQNYEDWEKAMIAAGPVILIGHQYWTWMGDQFAANSPTLPIIGFLISVAAWGVAVR